MLSEHYEWFTAHVMVTWSIWDKNGFTTFHGQPIFTFQNIGDKGNVQEAFIGGVVDKNGNGYYVSYPPTAFQFPYLIFKVLGVHRSVKNLQYFSLFFHFLGAVILFFFLLEIYCKQDITLPAWIGYGIYIFSANNLWFLGNVWFADMMVLPFLISSLYTGYLYWNSQKRKYLLLFLACIFCMTCIEWIGILFSISFIIVGFTFFRKEKKYLILSGWLIIINFAALSILFLQYLRIADFNDLINFWIFRFKSRTFKPIPIHLEESYPINALRSWQIIFDYFKIGYSKMFRWIIFVGIVTFALQLFNRKKNKIEFHAAFLLLVFFVSLLIFHFLFFNFTANHDFSLLKISILLSIAGAYFVHLIVQHSVFHKNKLMFGGLIVLSFLWATKQSIEQYYLENNNSSCPSNLYIDICNQIKQKANPDEAVFIFYNNNKSVWLERPQRCYYAQRIVIDISSESEAQQWIEQNKIPKGIIFVDSSNQIVRTIKIKSGIRTKR